MQMSENSETKKDHRMANPTPESRQRHPKPQHPVIIRRPQPSSRIPTRDSFPPIRTAPRIRTRSNIIEYLGVRVSSRVDETDDALPSF
jgi:hypothetical protein